MTEARNNPVVWVTGAGGLIGNYVVHSPARPHDFRIVGLARTDLDLLDSAVLEQRFRTDSPALVIHCAAISTAAACARQPELTREMNVAVTQRLTDLCADSSQLVLLSTDLVFDGRKGHYTETDAVNPLNLYGETKVEAERIVLSQPNNLVIRTSLNAGSSPTGDRSFAEQTHTAWQRGETLKLFTDEFRNPIGADLTARALWELAITSQPPLTRPSATLSPSDGERDGVRGRALLGASTSTFSVEATGIFHVAGAERLNRLQIGQLLAAQWPDLDCRMQQASLRDFPGPPRAADCSLNCAKAQSLLSFPLPRFSEWLTANPVPL